MSASDNTAVEGLLYGVAEIQRLTSLNRELKEENETLKNGAKSWTEDKKKVEGELKAKQDAYSKLEEKFKDLKCKQDAASKIRTNLEEQLRKSKAQEEEAHSKLREELEGKIRSLEEEKTAWLKRMEAMERQLKEDGEDKQINENEIKKQRLLLRNSSQEINNLDMQIEELKRKIAGLQKELKIEKWKVEWFKLQKLKLLREDEGSPSFQKYVQGREAAERVLAAEAAQANGSKGAIDGATPPGSKRKLSASGGGGVEISPGRKIIAAGNKAVGNFVMGAGKEEGGTVIDKGSSATVEGVAFKTEVVDESPSPIATPQGVGPDTFFPSDISFSEGSEDDPGAGMSAVEHQQKKKLGINSTTTPATSSTSTPTVGMKEERCDPTMASSSRSQSLDLEGNPTPPGTGTSKSAGQPPREIVQRSSTEEANVSGRDRNEGSSGPTGNKIPRMVAEVQDPFSAKSSCGRKRNSVPTVTAKGPKKPCTAFLFFNQEKRSSMDGNLSFNEKSKMVGEMWRNTNESDRAPYKRMERNDKIRYNKELRQQNSKQKGSSNNQTI